MFKNQYVQLLICLFDLWTLSAFLEPMEKTINLRETTKNKILIAEGFLLLLCVMLPSAILLFKVVALLYNDQQHYCWSYA